MPRHASSRLASLAQRTLVPLIVLQASGLGLLSAHPAAAQPALPPPGIRSGPSLHSCAEGPALLAARIAYAQARIAPSPDQQDAWATFAGAWRAAVQPLDALCSQSGPPRPEAGTGAQLDAMQRHAAAMQQMFAALRDAVQKLEPSLTTVQKEVLAQAVLPPPPPGHGPMGAPGAGRPHGGPWLAPGFPGPDESPDARP